MALLVSASLLLDLAFLSPQLGATGIAGSMLDLGGLTVLLFAGERLAERYLSAAASVLPAAGRGAWLVWLLLLVTPWLVGPGGTDSTPIVEGLPGLLIR